MTTNTKAPARAVALAARGVAQARVWSTPPLNMEERLQRIEAMGQRIDRCIRFMCQVASLNGASAEAKQRAVADFYEQMVVVESLLGRIQENLQLE